MFRVLRKSFKIYIGMYIIVQIIICVEFYIHMLLKDKLTLLWSEGEEVHHVGRSIY